MECVPHGIIDVVEAEKLVLELYKSEEDEKAPFMLLST
jgi:hypothetical protein